MRLKAERPGATGEVARGPNVISQFPGCSREFNPSHADAQRLARHFCDEARDLTGAAAFAALSLSRHFLMLAGGRG